MKNLVYFLCKISKACFSDKLKYSAPLAVFIALLLQIYSLDAIAQKSSENPSVKLAILCRNMKDSVVLRWAPGNAFKWSRNNTYGYKLERFVIDIETKERPKAELISKDTIRPWSLSEWKVLFTPDHPYAPAAAQALYGLAFNSGQALSEVDIIRDKSQELEMRYSFSVFMADLDSRVADGLGLRWVDRNPPEKKRVQYRLVSLDPQFPDTAYVGINRSDAPMDVPVPIAPEFEEGDKQIKLRWDVNPKTPIYTAWWLERSDDGLKWTKTSKAPMVSVNSPSASYAEPKLFYTDTLIEKNYVPIKYRLLGITPFGEISQASEIITAMGRDKTPPPSPEIKDPQDVGGKLKIAWKYPIAPGDLKGFWVGKASLISGPFEPAHKELLSSKTREWVDPLPNEIGENYYIIYAIDTAGNTSASLPAYGFLKDSIPPSKPEKPNGSIDTNGVVRLHWKLGKEKDIIGYRVFYANAPDHEFSILTPKPHSDTTFTDTITLNTLTNKIFYSIVAVDRNFNHSSRSEVLVLQKPDTIAPVAPIFSNYLVTDTAVVLYLIESSSKDILEHTLFRKESAEEDWKAIFSWKKPVSTRLFSDLKTDPSKYYYYKLQASDSSGNKSAFSPTLSIQTLPKVSNQKLSNVKALYNRESKTIELSWLQPLARVSYYVVYRGKDAERPLSLTSFDGDKNTFEDTSFGGNGAYHYLIKAFYVDNGESPFASFPLVEVK